MARAERSGAGAFLLCPLGGGVVRQGAASVRARCRTDGGPEHGLAAQRLAGAVQRRRGISRCTDRSAGGCADRPTFMTTRARAVRGLDAAEASPRRCASWRSRGRRWRGPSARATERPCRLSAVQPGPLPAAQPGVPGTPLVREPRPPATALRQRLAAPERAAPCRCLGRPQRSALRRRTSQRVVHNGWGKRRALTGELLPPVGLEHLACRGSRGKRLARGGSSRARSGRRAVIPERLRLAKHSLALFAQPPHMECTTYPRKCTISLRRHHATGSIGREGRQCLDEVDLCWASDQSRTSVNIGSIRLFSDRSWDSSLSLS